MPSPEVSNPGPSPEPVNYDELEEEEFSDDEFDVIQRDPRPLVSISRDNESDNMSYERTPQWKKKKKN